MSGGGATASTIATPKGGGALQAIGEKFSPDLHTGTGNFSVPISLPAGRNGFTPQLSLGYHSGAGNGPFGLGFSLGIPTVTRRTAKGVPRYRDGAADARLHDVFILSGVEDLVPIERASGITRYRPRTEGLFAKIERHDALDHWVVRNKDGTTSRFGVPLPDDLDRPIVADPAGMLGTFTWHLSDTTDPFGNRIEYHYARDRSTDPRPWDQLYIEQIRYGDYTDGPTTKYVVTVDFEYEQRPDAFSDSRAGFEIRTSRRCRRISISTHTDTDRLFRTIDFAYVDQRPELAERVPLNRVSLLSRIVVTGHDGTASEALPPMEFDYSRFEPALRRLTRLEGRALPPQSLAGGSMELVDLFGRGMPDILEMSGTTRYWRNLGGARFDLPREMSTAPAGMQLSSPGVQLVDADGDGRTDLLVTQNRMSGYYPLTSRGGWDARSFQPYEVAPSFDLKDPNVHLVDLNGDGVTDAIRSGTRLECFFNDPVHGWKETAEIDRRALTSFPNVSVDDPRVRWADMSGDGLQDIVLLDQGGTDYWPARGWGQWGARVAMRTTSRLPHDYDPHRVLLGDVDGDGAADLLYVGDGAVTLWINQSGNAWSEPIVIRGTPPMRANDSVRLVDILGNGIPGLLWSADAEVGGRARMFFLDLVGGHKPYLMNEVRNGMGAMTRITYAPSTRFYQADQADPRRRWSTSLPFPVQVVAQVESIDALSGGRLTSEYVYHHGYWDGVEREFRGFGRVDHRDTEVFATAPGTGPPESFAPPVETRTWFHQGPVRTANDDWGHPDYSNEYWSGDRQSLSADASTVALLGALDSRSRRDALRALRGSVLRTEAFALDGSDRQDRPYTVTEGAFGVREESPLYSGQADRMRVFFPHPVAQRSSQWERGDDPMTSITFTDGFDDHGRPRYRTDIALPRNSTAGSSAEPYLASLAETVYALRDDSSVYIADRNARVTTWQLVNDGSMSVEALHVGAFNATVPRNITGQTLSYYDGAAFVGAPLGALDAYGAEVRTQRLVMTPALLRDVYRGGSVVAQPPELPPYLAVAAPPAWPAEYPAEFVAALAPAAGYSYSDGTGDGAEGYFAITERRSYDFHHNPHAARGLLERVQGPLGAVGSIASDQYGLRTTEILNPAGLSSAAVYEYRTLQPSSMTDANGNRTMFAYTPLGLLATVAELGRDGESVGDTADVPGVRYHYGWDNFVQSGEPVSTHTTRRLYRATDLSVPPAERDAVVETAEFTDGFGRLLQTRSQAEPMAFGDPLTGDAALSADPNAPIAPATGRPPSGGATRVVVSGWKTYDNKGRTVERYEPFYAEGWQYLSRKDADPSLFLNKVVTHYDARGQPVRVVASDGSEQRVVHGVPLALNDPDRFTPTPWEVYSYDSNDNAGRTHPHESQGYASHWNTPSSTVTNARGQVIAATERGGPQATTDWYTTRSGYDANGNLERVTDPLGRVAGRFIHDLRGTALRLDNADGGLSRVQVDAAGLEIERREGGGALILRSYDIVGRPSRIWSRRDASSPMLLRERLEYGDAGDAQQPPAERAANAASKRLGRLATHHDEAGVLTFVAYDLKGSVLDENRRTVSDEQLRTAFDSAAANQWRIPDVEVDWSVAAGSTLPAREAQLLDPWVYAVASTYGAVGQMLSATYPEDATGARSVLRLRHNAAGAMEGASLDGHTCVDHVAYNAKGQRTLIAYGNGLMTRYAYDTRSLRLARLRTERYVASGADPQRTFTPTGPGSPLYDCTYEHDLAGNVRSITDRTPGSGTVGDPDALRGDIDPALAQRIAAGDAIIRRFEHDPLYRLGVATGRECTAGSAAAPAPWTDAPRCGFGSGAQGTPTQDNAPQLTSRYRELYAYDAAGNLTSMRHETGGGAWVRRFGFAGLAPEDWAVQWPLHLGQDSPWTTVAGNQLTHARDENGVASPTAMYEYDRRGNLVRQGIERRFRWDAGGRLASFVVQTPAAGSTPADDWWAEPSIAAFYLYDSAGQRVKKFVRTQGGGWVSTTYLGTSFEHRRWSSATGSNQNTTCYVMDDTKRIASARTGDPDPTDQGPAIQFHLGDHLGSSVIIANETGSWVSREEYSPYGETTFGGFARKRFRFTGKERDAESGLAYHGARYLAPWLGRWISCDALGFVDGPNVYTYVRGRPLSLTDPTGRQAERLRDVAESMRAIDPATVRTGVTLVLLQGGAAATAGSGSALAAAGAAALAAAPVVLAVAAVAVIGWGAYQCYQLYKARGELAEAKQRLAETQRRLAHEVDIMHKNGMITDDELLLFRSTGNLVIQPRSASNSATGGSGQTPAPAQKEAPKTSKGPARIPHSTGRPLTVRDFNRGGKAAEVMHGIGFERIGIQFLQQKAIRDSQGDVMEPRRIVDFHLIDIEGVHPLDVTTPGQEGSAQKAKQIARDLLHATQSPDRTVRDAAGKLLDLLDDVVHSYGFPILPPKTTLKN